MKKIIVMVIFALLLSSNLYAANAYTNDVSNDIFVVTRSENSSEERYVQSLANELNISYKEAYEMNQKENQEYLSEIGTLGLDEIINYKTLIGSTSLSGAPQSVEMAVEVKYVYSYTTGKALEIMSVGEPHMYIPGLSNVQLSGGGYNKEVSTTNARISRTATLVYEVGSSTGITIGGDILNISQTSSETYTVTTRAKTYVMSFGLSDL
ncbi:hypothetical protein Amet_4694 [Alkaliphilus metalliredigens QYMF]|uniref:Uncharacterized protein n=1 Tax=Alkaliphilus metalliredigens (strain QYMF) TaxID=293826 RepID=A6TX44_ALKMQ|nr:hypothetical protein [Alkaliphilus metalliredigens]ABR50762.1 hypothetical protein Amet_4694 [Alkaliphilus metalliredigens QYMF]